jgi:hypothetical protein
LRVISDSLEKFGDVRNPEGRFKTAANFEEPIPETQVFRVFVADACRGHLMRFTSYRIS